MLNRLGVVVIVDLTNKVLADSPAAVVGFHTIVRRHRSIAGRAVRPLWEPEPDRPRRRETSNTSRDDVLFRFATTLIDGDPTREQQKAALRRAFGDMKWEVPEILDRMDKVDDVYFDRVNQIHLARWSTGRVAVVGDAAACASRLPERAPA